MRMAGGTEYSSWESSRSTPSELHSQFHQERSREYHFRERLAVCPFPSFRVLIPCTQYPTRQEGHSLERIFEHQALRWISELASVIFKAAPVVISATTTTPCGPAVASLRKQPTFEKASRQSSKPRWHYPKGTINELARGVYEILTRRES